MAFKISDELCSALELLFEKLPLGTIKNVWDAWRMETHKQPIIEPVANAEAAESSNGTSSPQN